MLILLLSLISQSSFSSSQKISLIPVKNNIYAVVDNFYFQENSIIYVGKDFVTAIGATWTPETAKLLATEVAKISSKPIKVVINTNYHPDRAGGNAYFKSVGAKVISTKATYDLLKSQWESMITETQKSIPSYPKVALVLPDTVFESDFSLQNGKIKVFYLGPSHTPDGVFVHFPDEKVLYGNCILKETLGNLDHANLIEYPKTLQKLKDLHLNIDTVVAGHGSPIHGPKLITDFIRLLKQKH